MDNLRIHEKNIASSEIKRIKNLLSKNKDTIDRLSNIDTDIEFNKKQIEKLKKCCKEFDEKLEILNKRYDDLSSNILDNELKEKILTADIDMVKRQEKTDKKISDKNAKKENDKIYLDKDKKNGKKEYNLDRETHYFFNNCNSLPVKKLNNLKNMPNNKGYIWNRISHFGFLPKESDTVILFEQVRNSDIQKIHEYKSEYYTIYHKKKNEKYNKIISKEKRISLLTTEQWAQIKYLASKV